MVVTSTLYFTNEKLKLSLFVYQYVTLVYNMRSNDLLHTHAPYEFQNSYA